MLVLRGSFVRESVLKLRSNHSKTGFVPLILAVLAIGCGVLRCRELYGGFEPATGLAIPGAPATLLLWLAVVVTLIFSALSARFMSGEKRDYRIRYAEGPGSLPLLVGMAMLVLSGPADFLFLRLSGTPAPVSRLILMAFGTVAGVLGLLSLIGYKNGESEKLRGFFALCPVFFGCYLMVIIYREIAAIPSAERYVYQMLGAAGLVLSWYFAAAHGFDIGRPRLAFFCAAVTFLMLTLCVVGDAAAWFVHGILPEDVGFYPYLAAGMLWSFGGVCAFVR